MAPAMKTTSKIFVISILVPAVVLGWIAFRAALRQGEVIVRQEAQIRQNQVDQFAFDINERVLQRVIAIEDTLDSALQGRDAWSFARLLNDWSGPDDVLFGDGVAFALDLRGRMLSPVPGYGAAESVESDFYQSHHDFLIGRAAAEVYRGFDPEPQPQASKSFNRKSLRNVIPAQNLAVENSLQLPTELSAERSKFAELIEGRSSGVLARFVQDRLNLLLWVKADTAEDELAKENLVFGWSCSPSDLLPEYSFDLNARGQKFMSRLSSREPTPSNVCFAILDDKGDVYMQSIEDVDMDWQRPFVAAEIGQVFPHWEVAAYLVDPGVLDESARLVRLSLFATIAISFGVMLIGCVLVFVDMRKQADLAQKKTDFVSNVSHELKTPLTSIRMFAELLKNGANKDPEKSDKFLNIIVADSERLTRLINNVLDFSKMDRGKKQYRMEDFDLIDLLEEIWQTHGMHLRNKGYEANFETELDTWNLHGDRDAIAQVVVNLLSNAEKYSDEVKDVSMAVALQGKHICIQILDRGIGIPAGSEHKIFEQFYRAHDSLSSGIQGSGLGLTLAKQIITEHGGRIEYSKRDGGGSEFAIYLPTE
ncbi:MAG: sensor histidine kinase [Opitutales bacterium]